MEDELALAQREARIAELRSQRVPFREIAKELDISHQRVHTIWRNLLERIPTAHLDRYRDEERELCDDAARDLLTLIRDPQATPSNRVRAWEVLAKWAERKSRLLGLDAPIRRELEISDTGSWEHRMRAVIAEEERALRAERALEASCTEEEDDR
jgi:hypothetical protein